MLSNFSDDLHFPPTSSGRILCQLDKIDKIWAEVHPVVKQVLSSMGATKEQVAKVTETNLPLLRQMNKAVGLYEQVATIGQPGFLLHSPAREAGKQMIVD